MGMGRRKRERQEELWIPADELPRIPRHVFYEKLNGLLAEADFDDFVEELCEPHYAKDGRDSIPPARVTDFSASKSASTRAIRPPGIDETSAHRILGSAMSCRAIFNSGSRRSGHSRSPNDSASW